MNILYSFVAGFSLRSKMFPRNSGVGSIRAAFTFSSANHNLMYVGAKTAKGWLKTKLSINNLSERVVLRGT
jgi:hypothetical protein